MSSGKNASTNAIQFSDDGVYIVEKRGLRERIADSIRVTAFGASEPGTAREEAYTVVRFVDRDGKRKKVIVASHMLVSQPGEFVALLAQRGYLWPPTQALRHKIVGELSILRPDRRIRVTPVPGWHGKSFVLPGESYTPNGPDRKHFHLGHNSDRSFGRISAIWDLGAMERAHRESLYSFHPSAVGRSSGVRCAEFAAAQHQQFRLQLQWDDVERKNIVCSLWGFRGGFKQQRGTCNMGRFVSRV